MLKVCVIGNEYMQQFPVVGYGGIESYVENLCIGINKNFKDKIKFCVFVPKILEKNNTNYDFNIIEVDFIENSKSGQHRLLFAEKVAKIISESEQKPDIIWSQSPWSVNYLSDLGIPMIVSIYDSIGWDLFKDDMKLINKNNVYYRFLSNFHFNNILKDADVNPQVNSVKEKSFWCYTGMPDEEYLLETEKENYILWVAGFNFYGMEGKGLDIFLKLSDMLPNENFVVYGSGDHSIESFLKSFQNKKSNFEYRGPLKKGSLHTKIFSKSKLFTLLSQWPESFARTGLEAITKGTPVLTSTKGSNPEIYSSIATCTDDLNKMAEAILKPYNYNDVYAHSKKFQVKNEIETLYRKSLEILNCYT
jgi:glycosyltransferase involved in cell wall biosynthesis